jgi:MFS family permease
MRYPWIPGGATVDSRRLVMTRALRGFADGLVSILLPSYLTTLGLSATQIGILLFGTLFGSALVTLWAGLAAHRFGCRRLLVGACALMLGTGLLFGYLRSFWSLFVVAFIGTLNPSAGDVSLFLPLEQAALADTVTMRDLTYIFAIYNVAGAFAGAFGALFSGLPSIVAARFDFKTASAQRWVFLVYAAVALILGVMYRSLSVSAVAQTAPSRRAPFDKSRGIVMHLAALFSLDAFSGGLIVQSMLAFWLFRRFGMSTEAAGVFFFASNLIGSMSQFVSSALAARLGRIRTMVYTHLPSNCFLFLAALMPNAGMTIVLLLLRSALSQMDVPARQSYVMAMVPAEERATAASVMNVPRSLASSMGPIPTGWMLDLSSFGWPLICAALLKATYDVLLLLQFGSLSPVDELSADAMSRKMKS